MSQLSFRVWSRRLHDFEARRLSGWGRLGLAFGLYVCVTGVYFAIAPRTLLLQHTPYNHFAHLAHAWLNGRLDLGDAPPPYAQNNDFALFNDKWYVAFPPFPAVILLPVVAFAKEPERVRDAQIFLWLAALAPALLFLALERLRDLASYARGTLSNLVLASLFAFGTVYFFTALQGTVWFAAHVVGTALAAGYLYCALGAAYPVSAGILLGLASLTRAPLIFAFPLFLIQAFEFSQRPLENAVAAARWAPLFIRRLDLRRLSLRLLAFGIPVLLCVGISLWHNQARFGSPWETGYQYLTVAWKARMSKWGLFHVHYLPRNLGVVLSQLPWFEPGLRSFKINAHGLALWFTTPLYLWLIWPKNTGRPHSALWWTAACVAIPSLFYQNTGWSQFGYRFSNDYAVFLFALLAVGARRFSVPWLAAALLGVAVNAFGAVTFGRAEFNRFYFVDGSQERFYQPD